MQQANARLTAALKAGERSPAHTTRLGGVEVGPQIQAWSLDSAYGTDLPPAMRAFAGSSSAQLEVTLSGTGGVPAPALYGPWAPHATADVARPGQSVVHGWGIGADTLPAFRGKVRARSAKSGGDTVTLTALDGAEQLRMPAVLPRPSGGIDQAASGVAATDWVASATWCVDHLLRNAGIHTSPPPRPGATLYVSYHGGVAANIGTLSTLFGGWNRWSHPTPPFTAAAKGPTTGRAIAVYVPTVRSVNRNLKGSGFFFECFFDTTGAGAANATARLDINWTGNGPDWRTALSIDWTGKRIVASAGESVTDPTQNSSLTWTPPQMATESPGRWHAGFWVTVSDAGAVTVEYRLTGPSGQVMVGLSAPIPGVVLPAGAIRDVSVVLGDLAVEAAQFTPTTAIPTSLTQDGLWKRGATLDAPALPLTVIPVVNGTAWDVITAIAKATLSTAEFSAAGLFVWRSGARWNTAPGAADFTVTSARELASLTTTEEIDACRNYTRVKWQSWAKVKAVPGYRSSPDIFLLPATFKYFVKWEVGEDELDPLPPMTVGGGSLVGQIRFTLTNANDVPAVFGAVDVGISRADGILSMSIHNKSAQDVWVRCIRGGELSYSVMTPALPGGTGAVDNWSSAQNTISQAVYGRQAFDHDAAGWVQESAGAAVLADTLLTAGKLPVPLLGDVEILPDPRVQLGDVVRVVDRTGAQLDTLAWVVGNRISASDAAVSQALTLRGTASPGVPTDVDLTPDPPLA